MQLNNDVRRSGQGRRELLEEMRLADGRQLPEDFALDLSATLNLEDSLTPPSGHPPRRQVQMHNVYANQQAGPIAQQRYLHNTMKMSNQQRPKTYKGME